MLITIYRDRKKQWRWNFRANNHKIIAVGSEGYKRRRSVLNALRMFRALPYVKVLDLTGDAPPKPLERL